MKLIYGLTLSLSLAASIAQAETCRMTIPGMNETIETSAPEKHKAHSKAVERCVELKEKNIQNISETAYGDIIDDCTVLTCENKS